MLRAEDNFSNPVYNHDWPDPAVWRGDDGRHYSFSTAGSKYSSSLGKFLVSPDLVKWDTIPENVWTKETLTKLKQYGTNLWAPHVVKIKGNWLMYLTCYTSAQNSSIVVLTLNSERFPTQEGKCGPWSFANVVSQSIKSGIIDTIDPFVTTDPETGKVWMFFGSTGKDYRVELSEDGLSLAPDAEYEHVAGLSYSQDNSREKVFEGSYLYHHNGYWYYFVSSGTYSDYTYDVKVGRSQSLTGPFEDRDGHAMIKGYATTILSTDNAQGAFWGPGHLGDIITDEAGRTYAFFHSHGNMVPIKVASYSPRALVLQQMFWDETTGWPYFKEDKPQENEIAPTFHLSTYNLHISEAGWATLYLPFSFEVPEGMEVYSVSSVSDFLLDLIPVMNPQANTPYLIHAVPGTYPINGFAVDTLESQSFGLLTGTQTSMEAPIGSYILQNQEAGIGFYQVLSGTKLTIGAHRAYLTLPSESSRAHRLLLNHNEPTGITRTQTDPTTIAHFTPTGLSLKSSRQGFHIVQYSNGTYRKSIIK